MNRLCACNHHVSLSDPRCSTVRLNIGITQPGCFPELIGHRSRQSPKTVNWRLGTAVMVVGGKTAWPPLSDLSACSDACQRISFRFPPWLAVALFAFYITRRDARNPFIRTGEFRGDRIWRDCGENDGIFEVRGSVPVELRRADHSDRRLQSKVYVARVHTCWNHLCLYMSVRYSMDIVKPPTLAARSASVELNHRSYRTSHTHILPTPEA
jgi:hypothetical protein